MFPIFLRIPFRDVSRYTWVAVAFRPSTPFFLASTRRPFSLASLESDVLAPSVAGQSNLIDEHTV